MMTTERTKTAIRTFVMAFVVTVFPLRVMGADDIRIPQIWGPQEPPFVPTHPIAIVGGMLVDATGVDPKLDYTVIIEGDRITSVGPNDEVSIPKGAQVINAEGMTIMPGIINSNQHLDLNPLYPAPAANMPLDVLKARWMDTFTRMPHRAFIYLMQGVTSMRHTSGPWKRIVPMKKKIAAGEIAGPRQFCGCALLMSDEHFRHYIESHHTPTDARDWMRNKFAYTVIEDVDKDTDQFLGPEFDYWKLLMSSEAFDGENDFTDEELRFIIEKAHANGKVVDVHMPEGGSNHGIRRMLPFDFDTIEHPFSGRELIDEEVIDRLVEKDVIVATLLTVKVAGAENMADPSRFNETLYIASMRPDEYRILMRYRDRMLFNKRHPAIPGLPIYPNSPSPKFDGVSDEFEPSERTYNEAQRSRQISRRNMRRFIKAGAKFSLGTDTAAFMNFPQENPAAREFHYMIEMGMTPMQAILAATRNGAEALGMLDQLGTIEEGKLADVIVVAGNPLLDPEALNNVYTVIKGGVRYK